MSGPEHYKKAEELLDKARGSHNPEYDGYVTRAQVHATLALAAATALTGAVASSYGLGPDEMNEWQKTAAT